MSTKFASAGLTAGELNTIVEKLGGDEGARRFLRGELSVSKPTRPWREEDGVIYFSVVSDGTTGKDWTTRLESKGLYVSTCAMDVLCSQYFKPTSRMTTEVAVLKDMLFEDNDRTMKKLIAEANKRDWSKPNAEIACLICEMFTDKEIEAMGLSWIAVIHEPIKDFDGVRWLLCAECGRNDCRLDASPGGNGCGRWIRGGGFAFAVSQVGSQS